MGYNLGYINSTISQSLQNKDALSPEFQKTLGDLNIPPTKEKNTNSSQNKGERNHK